MDIPVVLGKLNVQESKKNVYGEATSKTWYRGVQIPAIVKRDLASAYKDLQTVNVEQTAEFYFLRSECESRGIAPEQGDVIWYNNLYFEIDNVNEVQLVAGQPIYSHSVVVSAHLTRPVSLQIEAPNV